MGLNLSVINYRCCDKVNSLYFFVSLEDNDTFVGFTGNRLRGIFVFKTNFMNLKCFRPFFESDNWSNESIKDKEKQPFYKVN